MDENSELEAEFWEPTMLLRWQRTGKRSSTEAFGFTLHEDILNLQQQWISDRGNFEWRDIEVE